MFGFLCTSTLFLLFQIRHNIRPYFQVSDTYRCIYDVITWAGTQVAISYTVVPFVVLAVGPSLKFYRYVCVVNAMVLCSSVRIDTAFVY